MKRHTGVHPYRISDSWKKFLIFYTCFAVFTCFTNTFINTFLMKATGSTEGVMLYNIVLAMVQPFAMVASVYVMRRKTPLFTQRIGILLYAAVFVTLAVTGEQGVRYIMYISAILSVANGFFFTTYSLQLLSYTQDSSRDADYGLQVVLGNVTGLVLPTLSGLLLAVFSDFTGYRILFLIGLTVSVTALYFSTKLSPLKASADQSGLKKALKAVTHSKAALAAMLSSTANGFYDGTMLFFLNMLIYAVVANEALVGISSTCASIAAIVASAIYVRAVRPKLRAKSILLSVGAAMLLTLSLLVSLSPVIMFILNMAISGLHVFFSNPSLTAYYGVAEHEPGLEGLGAEVHTIREFWYGSGRVIGILMTMFCMNFENGSVFAILIILVLQSIPAILMKKMTYQAED